MTKRKAIEAAMDVAPADVNPKEGTWAAWFEEKARISASRAYDEGSFAGMRKLVNMLPSKGLIRAGDTKRKLRGEINALAKKHAKFVRSEK